MPHAEVLDHTRLAHAELPLSDEHGAPVLAVLLQGTFAIDARAQAVRALAVQPPVEIGGLAWPPISAGQAAEAAEIEWRFEPQTAFAKPGCDVLLHGHALAPQAGAMRTLVGFAIGGLKKCALVHGPRHLLDGRRIVERGPIERVPLRYGLAFGGWDRRDPDPARHVCERRNPLGCGFRDPRAAIDRDVELPPLEDPDAPIGRYGAAPSPAGFGFVGAHWLPRAQYAGTYDAAWQASRMPLLPLDFDCRYFLAASPGLQLPAAPADGERITVLGTTPAGRVDFALPSLGTPLFHAHLRGRRRLTLKLRLDTVIVDTDAMCLTLLWRHPLPLRNGPHDLVAGEYHLPDPRAQALRRPREG